MSDQGDPARSLAAALDAAADELYGLAPAAFTSARDARAGEARRAGDKDLAAAIKKLRRPTAGAWLANLLVRRRHQQISALLELGTVMREAQSRLAGDDLRRLSRQRQQVVAELGRDARRLARDAGAPVGDGTGREVEATLEAALADATASEALRSGRLTRALRYSGLGPETALGMTAPVVTVPGSGAGSPGPVPVPAGAAVHGAAADGVAVDGVVDQVAEARRRREERTEAAERALGEAVAAVGAAENDVEGAGHGLESALDRLDDANRQVAETEGRLADLRARQELAVNQAGRADVAREEAEAALRRARERVSAARETLDGCRR